MRIAIILILFLAIGGASYFAYQKYINPNTVTIEQTNEIKVYNSNKTDFDLEIEKIRSVAKEPRDINSLKYYGWIPDWDMADGLKTLINNPQITSVSPFWFDLNEDGSLKSNIYTNWDNFIEYTSSSGVMLVPTVTSFDKDILTKVLNSPENTQNFINQVINQIQENNYQGIDLDFESFYFNDQKLFFDLLKKLKSKLQEINKVLYFSSLPKWGDNISYAQSKATINYNEVGNIVDVFIIQGYSYSPTNALSIGPIGPIKWEEDIIRYAINSGIPREKIVLGIHTYAQDWSERPIQYDLLYYTPDGLPANDFGAEAAVAYYYNGIDKLLANYTVEQKFIDDWGEMLGSYDYNGQKRYVVYPNSQSIELRKKLAADYGLAGISYWRLGDEGSLKL